MSVSSWGSRMGFYHYSSIEGGLLAPAQKTPADNLILYVYQYVYIYVLVSFNMLLDKDIY